MDFIKNNKWTILVSIIFILFTFYLTPVTFQNDTFSAVKVGERIVNEGFPQYDNFSIHEGLTFTYPHWLFDVVVYLLYSSFGLAGLFLFSKILYLIFMITIYLVTSKISKNKIISFILLFPSLILITTGITVRAQVVSYILLLLQVYSIEKLLALGKKRYIAYLVLISFAIINVHVAVWPFYFILYLPYLINFFKIRFLRIEYVKYKYLKLLLLPFILSLVFGWLSPLGLDAYTYSIKAISSNSMMSNISEHLPPNINNDFGLTIFVYIFFIYIIFIVTKNNIKLTDISMLFGLTVMTLMSARHFHFLLIFTPIYMTSYILAFLDKYKIKFDFKKACDVIFSKPCLVLISGILVSVLCYYKDTSEQNYIPTSAYPVIATNYILNNIDTNNMRLYSHYNFGSYLILNDIKPFIDSRCDLYMDAYSKDITIANDFFATEQCKIHYEDTFKKYNITHILIYINSSLNTLLSKDNRAKVVYMDPSIIYIDDNNATNSENTTIKGNPQFVLYEWTN